MLKHFVIKEFVPPEVWNAEGENAIARIDPLILLTAEQVREFFDAPVTINNWSLGGQLRYRGYRPASCTVGAKKSMHREGKAIDFDIKGLTAQQGRKRILDNQNSFPHIRRMERGVSWVHVDIKDTGKDEIVLFNP